MKNIIATLILFCFILIVCFTSVIYLNRVFVHMDAINSDIKNCIYNDNWNKAEELSKEFTKDWHSYSNISSVFINHTLIDDISVEAHKMEDLTKIKDKEDALACNSSITFLLERLEKLEHVNFQNLF